MFSILGRPRGASALLSVSAVAVLSSLSAAHAQEQQKAFNIPAQSLSTTLIEFSRQSDIMVIADPSVVNGKRAPALQGSFFPNEALSRLLVGSGLTISQRPEGGFIVASATSPAPSGIDGGGAEGNAPAAAGSNATTARASGIEDILVTARRRDEKVQSIPVAISVISSEALRDNNVSSIADLQNLAPGLTAQATGFTRDALSVAIRGQGSQPTTGLAGVIAYLNEVPIPGTITGLAGGPGLFFDLENVQILKGPQGTLFGRNAVGGNVMLKSARPTNEFGGHFQIAGGNYNDRELDAAVSVPLVGDKLLMRVAVNGQKRDGFTHLVSSPRFPNGANADDRDYWSARGTLTFRPNDIFENDSILSYQEYDSNGSPRILTNVNPTNGTAIAFGYPAFLAQQQQLGIRSAVATNTPLYSSGDLLSLENISALQLSDNLTFKNIFGYRDASSIITSDSDSTIRTLVDSPSTPHDSPIQQYTDEVQLLGKAFDGRLDWIVGGFWLREEKGPFLQTQTIFSNPQDKIYSSTADSTAIFAQGSYDLSDLIRGLKFTAGARYTWDEFSLNQVGGIGVSTCVGAIVNCTILQNYKAESNALTWTFGLDYQVTPDTLLYVASRRGYRAGSFNIPATTLNPQFDPEFVTDIELGVKADWNIGAVPIRTNVAAYYQDYKDIQIQRTVTAAGSGFVITTDNAAAATIVGSEFEAIAQLTDNLRLGANVNYLELNYDAFEPGVSAATIATLQATRTDNRPRGHYGVNGSYRVPLGDEVGEVSVKANYSWQSKMGDVSQPIGGLIEDYGLLNMSVDWDGIAGSNIDASLFATNLTDEEYAVTRLSAYNSLGFATKRFGEPRMYGLRLRYRFGAEAN